VSAPSEVHDHLLGLLRVDAEVVFSAPTLQVFHLLPVVGLVVVSDASNYSFVIRKLYDKTARMSRFAVVCEQSEQKGTQHTHNPGGSLC